MCSLFLRATFIDFDFSCRRAMKSMGEPLNETELSMMMADADVNGDGKIDYEGNLEFKAILVISVGNNL